MRKKIFLSVLTMCAAAALAVSGCGGSGSDTGDRLAGAADESADAAGEVPGLKDADASDADTDAAGADVQDSSAYDPNTTEISGEIPDTVTKTVTITATGDCTLGVAQTQSYDGSFDAYYDSYGEDYFFEDVRSIFEENDLTIVNLECVLSEATERVEKTFNLKGAPEYAGILTGSSVEVCSMGNNHTYDYGEEGFQETKQVLSDAGITYAYSGQEGMFVTEDGVKVGIVSANLLSQSQEKLDTMEEEIQSLRDEGADLVIACCHWGIEKDYYPNEYQQTTAHSLIDAGADLIIGNHPHVLQGVEIYEGKVICYSLGNFCFGGNKNPSDKNTVIFQQTFMITDGEVETDEPDVSIIPCKLSSASSYNDYQPTVATGDTKQNIIDLVNEYSEALGGVSFDGEGSLS
ncbi:MAG: CapA family protein [Lachnospiraceae bacterium]|nr:CapA family protein [Lachnospiraceae bacterium]